MYKITAHFISDVAGVYTKEIETATTKNFMETKKSRMIDKWFKLLSKDQYILYELMQAIYNDDEKLELIQREIKKLNDDHKQDQPRQFLFYIEKIN
jgi:hypothetical protein